MNYIICYMLDSLKTEIMIRLKMFNQIQVPCKDKFTGTIENFTIYAEDFTHACKLQSEHVKAEEHYGDKIGTLVRVSDAKITRFVEENFNNLGSFQSRKTRVNGSAYEAGKEAGRNANIARGVSTGNKIATKMLS
jgi:hypothetical protein